MKELVYRLDEFDIEGFLKKYEEDFKYIYYSLEDEKIEHIVDLVNLEDLSVETNKLGEDLFELLNKEEKGLFLLIGAVADEDVRYYRFIDGVQYRVSLGEIYEHSAERFHDFETKEELINKGNIDFNVEISLGLAINKKEDKLVINFAEIKDSNDGQYLEYIYNSGELGRLTVNYLSNHLYN